MERPALPMWSHSHEEWVFDGVGFKDHRQADFVWSKKMLDYADYLEARVADLEGKLAEFNSQNNS